MSRVLVTGAKGFIGRPLVHALRQAGHDVVECDVRSLHEFQYWSFSDETPKFGAVIHLAARIDARASHAEANRYLRTNYVDTVALLDRCAALPTPPRFIFASTGMASLPQSSPYALSKRLVETALADYPGPHVALRLFNVAGAYGGYGEQHEPETHLIPRANAAMLAGTVLTVAYPGIVRDFVYLDDVVRAFVMALMAGSSGAVYDVGSGIGTRVMDVVDMVGCRHIVTDVYGASDEPSSLCSHRAAWLPGWTPTLIVDAIVASDMAWRKPLTAGLRLKP